MEKRLTPAQEGFCHNFASVESETFNRKLKSALAAGYSASSAATTATKLTNENPATMARIEEIRQKNYSENRPNCLSKFEFIYNQAIKKKDLANANVAAKHFAQACGVLKADNIIEKTAEKVILDETQKKEAKEYAKYRLLRGLQEEHKLRQQEDFSEVE